MAVKRYTKSFTIKLAAWHPDSSWELRSESRGEDDDQVLELTTKTFTDGIDLNAVLEADKRGESTAPIIAKGIRQETVMSPRNAALVHFTVAWAGPDFTLPKDYVKGEEFGKPEKDAKGAYVPHPLAGQLMPVAAEFVGAQDGEELTEVHRLLKKAHAARSDEAQAAFRKELARVAGGSVKPAK